jgi:hypothetical protein
MATNVRAERRRQERSARRQALLDGIVELARPLILESFRPDSCIASTAVALDTLAVFGIGARPLNTEAQILNAPLVARLDAGEALPSGEAAQLAWMDSFGGWSLGLGMGLDANPGHWPGHLVCWLNSGAFIDLSLDQASRPEKGIELTPGLFTPPPGFERGGVPAPFLLPGGTACIYEARPHDLSYCRAADWRDKRRRRAVVEQLVEKLRARAQ